MATKYKHAPEVKQIALELREEIPHLLGHLDGQRVIYVWRDKAQEKNGKTVLGTASLVGGRNALLATEAALAGEKWVEGGDFKFFVIEIAADSWKDLSDLQRRALVFHELLHCGEDDDGEPLLNPHDLEEFNAVPEHFGLWKQDVESFAQTLRNVRAPLRLPLDDLEESVHAARRDVAA